ncbi:TrbC/VirB2 family protein [Gilvimarinus chinensis]|uniref:TrbC/VirB2 family protein n=1 Tax=Gilvimarinus chinensis TaxID=396005 RepID=UPI0003659079|nr:TrbC/VirB2 family protein [Gilvimarinus chinensis]
MFEKAKQKGIQNAQWFNVETAERVVRLILVTLIACSPTFAHAAPWDDMADEIIDLLTNGFTRSIAIIACIALGLAAWAGKLTWAWGGRFIAGIVLIFGAASIVDVFIGAV